MDQVAGEIIWETYLIYWIYYAHYNNTKEKRGNQKPEKLKKGQENEYPILWPSSQIFNRDQMNIYPQATTRAK